MIILAIYLNFNKIKQIQINNYIIKIYNNKFLWITQKIQIKFNKINLIYLK